MILEDDMQRASKIATRCAHIIEKSADLGVKIFFSK